MATIPDHVGKTIGMGGVKILSLPLVLATSVMLARALGPDAYGDYAFVITVISVLALPVGPGISQLLTREVARFHSVKDWGCLRGLILRAHQWVALLGLLVLFFILAFWIVASQFQGRGREGLFLLASPLLFVIALNSVRGSALRGLQKPIEASLPELLLRPGLFLAAGGLILGYGNLTAQSAIVLQIFCTVVACIFGSFILRKNLPSNWKTYQPVFRSEEVRKSLMPFLALAFISTLNNELGIILLGLLGPGSEVAMLRVAQSGAMLVGISLVAVNSILGPVVVSLSAKNDIAELKKIIRRYTRLATLFCLISAVPLIAFGDVIIEIFYGKVYAASSYIALVALVTGQVVNVAFGSVGVILSMSGYERATLMGQVYALLINAIVGLLTIPIYGAVGAALAACSGLVAWNVLLTMKCRRIYGFSPLGLLLKK